VPLTFEQAERRAELTLRANALTDARVVLMDLQSMPEEALSSGSRWTWPPRPRRSGRMYTRSTFTICGRQGGGS
jgi:hypothetical protein